MRFAAAFLIFFGLGFQASALEKEALDISPLIRRPDLSPSLTREEVDKHFVPWVKIIQKMAATVKPEYAEALHDVHHILRPSIPKVSSITLYSLIPFKREIFEKAVKHTTSLAVIQANKDVLALPEFDGYPVLSSIDIPSSDEANRWTNLIRDQLFSNYGGMSACDFMPRHAIRFVPEKGGQPVDLTVCFECKQMYINTKPKMDRRLQPILSDLVAALIDDLFDKQKKPRDQLHPRDWLDLGQPK